MTNATVIYTEPAPAIARIVISRPKSGNAQNVQMTYEINEAFLRAAHDDAIKVIILGSEGKHFSTGHDLKDTTHGEVGTTRPLTSVWGQIDTETIEGWYGWERETYLDMCRRWRSIPKPTIAEVSGACFGGGLMLAWVCDLIVASEDAFFSDPVVNIGANGVEFFAHAYEIGARRAKEFLFTAASWTAQQAKEWGMVNRVVPRETLEQETLALASVIASKPMFALKMAKESVNASIDAQGQTEAINQAFAYHQLCHAHNRVQFGGLLDPSGIAETIRKSGTLSPLIAGTKGAGA